MKSSDAPHARSMVEIWRVGILRIPYCVLLHRSTVPGKVVWHSSTYCSLSSTQYLYLS